MKEENKEISAIGNGIVEMIKNLITMMLQPMKDLIALLFDNDEAIRTEIAEIMTTMNDKINAVVSNIEVEQSTYMGLKLHDLELKIDETVEHHRTLMLCVEEVKRGMVEKYQTLDGKIFELEEVVSSMTDVDEIADKVQDLEYKIDEVEDSRVENESNIEDLDNRIEEIELKLAAIGDILG
mgnify:FL=1|tara:strand:- start:158 stop:700 length:543 start_codon:yes stop_codon:yes gene_type:complete